MPRGRRISRSLRLQVCSRSRRLRHDSSLDQFDSVRRLEDAEPEDIAHSAAQDERARMNVADALNGDTIALFIVAHETA